MDAVRLTFQTALGYLRCLRHLGPASHCTGLLWAVIGSSVNLFMANLTFSYRLNRATLCHRKSTVSGVFCAEGSIGTAERSRAPTLSPLNAPM